MNTNRMTDELKAALARVIEGEAEPHDELLVAEMLRSHPELRAELRQQLELDALLRLEAEPTADAFVESVAARTLASSKDEDAFLQRVTAALPTASRKSAIQRSFSASWFSWRPLTAAAAGLVLGLFCASVVWAYAVPLAKGTTERAVAIFSEGFEDAGLNPGRRFPKRPNEWSGDLSVPVGAVADVKAKEGSRMMPLIPEPKRRFSYARRIVDLAEHPEVAAAKSLRLEVAASFNTAESARPSRYQIRLAAFSEAPAEVGAIWNNEPALFDTVLQHVGRNVVTQPGETGWKTVRASIQIPPGTRSIVISLAAGEADSEQPQAAHYLDDVQARFVISQMPVD